MKKQFWGLTWKLTLPAGVLLLAASLSVQAASSFDLRSKRGSGNSAEYAWDGTVLTVKDRANIIITGAVTDGTRIEVAAGATAAITLNGVSISGLKTGSRLGGTVDYFTHKKTFADIGLGPNQSPLALNSGAKVKLKIQGTNTLTAGDCANYKASVCAGITVPDSAALDIDGTDALTATGGWRGAGIGGVNRGNGGAGGAITIRGGTVTANAGRFGGSGIGSGSGDSITIRSGTVTANGSEDGGPGIGCYGGTITISGGTVVVHGGGISGQGIGGAVGGSIGAGNRMDSISDGKDLMITISGGTVTAYGSGEGAGIGGTIFGTDNTINITITGDANVTAFGGDGNTWSSNSGGGAGIGSDGNNYSANSADRKVGTIKIDTIGTVNATGGKGFRGGGPGENIGQGGGPGGSATKP